MHFNAAMYLIPKADVAVIEDIYSDLNFLYANIWLPANEGVLFDPMWLFAGSCILADIRSANRLLSLSTAAVPDTGGGVTSIKALAGVILQNHEMLHQASLDFLVAAKRKSSRPRSRRVPLSTAHGHSEGDVSLTDLSALVCSLCESARSAREQIILSSRSSFLLDRSKMASPKNGKSSPSVDTFDRIVLDFQERITAAPSCPAPLTVDVRFDRERFQHRLSSSCERLLQLQGCTSLTVPENRQKEVRHAVTKRRRQFQQTLSS